VRNHSFGILSSYDNQYNWENKNHNELVPMVLDRLKCRDGELLISLYTQKYTFLPHFVAQMDECVQIIPNWLNTPIWGSGLGKTAEEKEKSS
jgi:hypothetical protein